MIPWRTHFDTCSGEPLSPPASPSWNDIRGFCEPHFAMRFCSLLVQVPSPEAARRARRSPPPLARNACRYRAAVFTTDARNDNLRSAFGGAPPRRRAGPHLATKPEWSPCCRGDDPDVVRSALMSAGVLSSRCVAQSDPAPTAGYHVAGGVCRESRSSRPQVNAEGRHFAGAGRQDQGLDTVVPVPVRLCPA